LIGEYGPTGLEIEACSFTTPEADNQRGTVATQAINTYFPRHAAWVFSFKRDVRAQTFKFLDAATFAENQGRGRPQAESSLDF
jgi:hypothetical protein